MRGSKEGLQVLGRGGFGDIGGIEKGWSENRPTCGFGLSGFASFSSLAFDFQVRRRFQRRTWKVEFYPMRP